MASPVTTAAAATTPASSRPGWLKSRKSPESPTAATTPNVEIALNSETEPPRTWWRRCLLAIVLFWQGMYLGWGLTVSLAIHALVLVTLGITYFSITEDSGLSMIGGFKDAQPVDELDIPVDSRLDADSGGEAAAQLQFAAVTALSDQGAQMNSAETVLGNLDANGDDSGDSDRLGELGSNIKVPDSAITQGSFTVWTEPKAPKPRSKYEIIIQVKLPPSVKQYRLRDLTGMVVGTDGYRKQIKFKSTERRGVKEGVVQIAITIPSGAQLVKDTIQIRSQVLNEEQTIEIVF